MASKKFKMRVPPKKPVRETWWGYNEELENLIEDNMHFRGTNPRTLHDLIILIGSLGYTPKDISISNYYDMSVHHTESDFDYNTRMAEYKKKMEEYKVWYKENEEEVRAHQKAELLKQEEKLRKEQKKIAEKLAPVIDQLEQLGVNV